MSSWNSASREVQRCVVVAVGDGGDACAKLLVQHQVGLHARGQRRRPARGMRQPRRVEVLVGPGDVRRALRAHDAVRIHPMGPAQHPEFSEPGDVRELPGDRVQPRLLGHAPLRIRQVVDARTRHRRPSQRIGDSPPERRLASLMSRSHGV
jgi:hypothetical protein